MKIIIEPRVHEAIDDFYEKDSQIMIIVKDAVHSLLYR